jgi:hypothetical protein
MTHPHEHLRRPVEALKGDVPVVGVEVYRHEVQVVALGVAEEVGALQAVVDPMEPAVTGVGDAPAAIPLLPCSTFPCGLRCPPGGSKGETGGTRATYCLQSWWVYATYLLLQEAHWREGWRQRDGRMWQVCMARCICR